MLCSHCYRPAPSPYLSTCGLPSCPNCWEALQRHQARDALDEDTLRKDPTRRRDRYCRRRFVNYDAPVPRPYGS